MDWCWGSGTGDMFATMELLSVLIVVVLTQLCHLSGLPQQNTTIDWLNQQKCIA